MNDCGRLWEMLLVCDQDNVSFADWRLQKQCLCGYKITFPAVYVLEYVWPGSLSKVFS